MSKQKYIASTILATLACGLSIPLLNDRFFNLYTFGIVPQQENILLYVGVFCGFSTIAFVACRQNLVQSNNALTIFILFLSVLLRGSIAVQNPLFLQETILHEDAHYCFNIARNIADGLWFQHDSFNRTNGFQPLFVLLITPIFVLVNDKILAINFVLWLQISIAISYSIVLHRVLMHVAKRWVADFAISIWAVAPYFVKLDVNGFETNTAVLLLITTLYFYLKTFRDKETTSKLSCIKLGVLLGLAALARIDSLLLIPLIVLDIIINRVKTSGFGVAVKTSVLILVVAFFVLFPWLIFGYLASGSIVPISGQATRFISMAYGYRFLQNLDGYFELESIPFDYYWATIKWGWFRLVNNFGEVFPPVVAVFIIVLSASLDAFLKIKNRKNFGIVYIFFAVIFFSYTCYIFGHWFFSRYFVFGSIAYLMVVSMSMHRLYESVEILKSRHAKLVIMIAIFLLIGALATMSVRSVYVAHMKKAPSDYYLMAEWINTHTHKDARIGAFQTGILGYYLKRKFYGLDGKINAAALHHLEAKTIDEYVVDKKIDYILDWKWIITNLFVRRSKNTEFLNGRKIEHLQISPRYSVYEISNRSIR